MVGACTAQRLYISDHARPVIIARYDDPDFLRNVAQGERTSAVKKAWMVMPRSHGAKSRRHIDARRPARRQELSTTSLSQRIHRVRRLGRMSSELSVGRQVGQPEPISCDPAGGIAGFAGAAHVRPLAIDDAPCFDTDLSHQSGASVPVAPHAIQAVIDKLTRDAAQIVLILRREPRPVPRV
jgi:hypothetical protein